MKHKICNKCKKKKILTDFSKYKNTKDGYNNTCKECYKVNWDKNREKIAEKRRKQYKDNIIQMRKINNSRRIKNPCLYIWYGITQRCNNINNKIYGGKGIKNLLTKEECYFLWERDNAKNMKRPSIDRIDNDGDYILNNCRFIELGKNVAKQKIDNPKINPII